MPHAALLGDKCMVLAPTALEFLTVPRRHVCCAARCVARRQVHGACAKPVALELEDGAVAVPARRPYSPKFPKPAGAVSNLLCRQEMPLVMGILKPPRASILFYGT